MTPHTAACCGLALGAALLVISVALTVRDQERRETHLVNTTHQENQP